ncbi:hypothetical protein J2X31_003380 [Flavobacterium arsenatis]|uniref:DUF4294 domain-containing protein n=1 Tax=Flavobacterium arsenatis TaxID=1484332 RepID=A0ABU1TTZ3_9FLAO|nr:DUF4294 domain-containing protein [Flavobacterium arsenatis]MDR6969349.1 hypothetical protein [Flavobacterium arsenatis]
MKLIKSLLFIITFTLATIATAQEDKRDDYLKEQDTLGEPILLEEVIINPNQIKIDEDAKKRFLILQRRVYKVYPYAKTASERLTQLNKGMASLKTNKEKKKYFKITEKYITEEFEVQLKKLSRKDGQILVKLIHRQTGNTTFDLIKDLKSGWKAFVSNTTAKLFDIELKTKYDPMEVNEDYLIETILNRAFKNKRLVEQQSAFPINYEDVSDHWIEKLSKPKQQKE